MKKQYDVCLIYLSYVFEIIGLLAFKYFDNYISTHWITIGTDGNPIYGEVGLLYNLSVVIHYLFYFIIFVFFSSIHNIMNQGSAFLTFIIRLSTILSIILLL